MNANLLPLAPLFLAVALAPAPAASHAVETAVETPRQSREVRQSRQSEQNAREERSRDRYAREQSRELARLHEFQVDLARARIENDEAAVARLDGRVLRMLQSGSPGTARPEDGDSARAREDEARARVAAEWVRLEGRYEPRDLEQRVLLLDELVDIARGELRGDARERRSQGR